MLSRQSTCFCVVIVQCVCFLVCRCCCLCELNRRRRVRRFKRRLRLRLSCWAACVFARVFATFGGFILPLALAVAACAVVYVRARDSIYTQGGDRVLKVPRWGGVSPPRPILIHTIGKITAIQARLFGYIFNYKSYNIQTGYRLVSISSYKSWN